jgi:hypothetical protein
MAVFKKKEATFLSFQLLNMRDTDATETPQPQRVT